MLKSDENAGRHVWEVCGLGVAPFRFVDFAVKIYRATPDAPAQPGASCQYCGQGIMNVCTVQDANGKRFVVGPDCIAKVGEAGIMKAFKSSRAYRALQAEKRAAKAKAERGTLDDILKDDTIRAKLQAIAHPSEWGKSQGKTFLDYAEWMNFNAGAAGRHRLLKEITKITEGA